MLRPSGGVNRGCDLCGGKSGNSLGHPRQPARPHGRRGDRNRHPARTGCCGEQTAEGSDGRRKSLSSLTSKIASEAGGEGPCLVPAARDPPSGLGVDEVEIATGHQEGG